MGEINHDSRKNFCKCDFLIIKAIRLVAGDKSGRKETRLHIVSNVADFCDFELNGRD